MSHCSSAGVLVVVPVLVVLVLVVLVVLVDMLVVLNGQWISSSSLFLVDVVSDLEVDDSSLSSFGKSFDNVLTILMNSLFLSRLSVSQIWLLLS